jgi:DNA-binding NtrC family response regulator
MFSIKIKWLRFIDPIGHPLVGSVKPLDEIEKDYILAVLKHNDGNQTLTATQLGIGTATLYRKLKKYGDD